MSCLLCGSGNEAEFTAEMLIHFCGLRNIDKPSVGLFPKLLVCLDCGASQFTVPESELALLALHSLNPLPPDGDGGVSSVRVLVVDDFEPFRRFVCSKLGQKLDLQVIGEASDGLEAVQKAEQLQPDLIVLDIGLPSLHGIEAARRILRCCSKSRILFLSQEFSADVLQEALSTGAAGYLVKTSAGSDLLLAVETVMLGRNFVSPT